MERCLTCKYYSGIKYMPLCSRVVLINTQRYIVPPPCKFQDYRVYEGCHIVSSNDNLCGKNGNLYEKNDGSSSGMKKTNPVIMIKGEYTEEYKQKYGKYLNIS
jgi:hypothetical protein